jgi:DNA-cytosine methyltransferase
MKHGSLFSGIGGFDLAAHWMGWENAFHCEWMEFPRKVLDYYFPEADSHVDICKTDFKKYEGNVDIITGGFPCQPFSMAGKRKGSEDERYLWHEMLRTIQEVKPKYVIAENVLGLTNIEDGLVFEQVWSDLEVAGYEVQPFVLPAASKGAPHQRQRIWIIAYRESIRRSGGGCEQSLSGKKLIKTKNGFVNVDKNGVRWGPSLNDIARNGMLPTPAASDHNARGNQPNWEGSDLGSEINHLLGTRSHLNPRFVAQMMGFPVNWTELPFLNGEQNQLKVMETQ